MKPSHGCSGITEHACIRRWTTSARCSSSKTGRRLRRLKVAADQAGCGNDGLWKARKTMMLFSDLPTSLGNRSSRFPHSHRHDYDGIIPKTSRLRDTHSEGKVKPQFIFIGHHQAPSP